MYHQRAGNNLWSWSWLGCWVCCAVCKISYPEADAQSHYDTRAPNTQVSSIIFVDIKFLVQPAGSCPDNLAAWGNFAPKVAGVYSISTSRHEWVELRLCKNFNFSFVNSHCRHCHSFFVAFVYLLSAQVLENFRRNYFLEIWLSEMHFEGISQLYWLLTVQVDWSLIIVLSLMSPCPGTQFQLWVIQSAEVNFTFTFSVHTKVTSVLGAYILID